MGLQINSQPQNFKSSVVIGDGLSAVDGLTVYGSLSASSSLQAPSISAGNVTALAGGKFYGDGSGLTNINAGNLQGFSGVTSVNTLTGAVTNVVFTGSANNFTGVNTFSQTTNFQAITGTTGNFSGNLSVSGTVFSSGQNLTEIFGEKGKTDSVFSTVQTITGTGLNTSSLTASNGTFTSLSAGSYLSGGQNLTGIFGERGKTDSVFSSVQANSASTWSAGNVLSSSGGTLGGNVRVGGNLIVNYLSALSGSTFVNTTFTTTSSLCVVATLNTGAALYVGGNGTGDIASFYDVDQNVEVLHVGGVNSTFPNVGIKVSNPNKTLTLSGDLSASGEVYASKYFLNNVDISSTYNTVNTGSANWQSAYTNITGSSANWNNTVTVVTGTSARWNTAYNLLTGGGTLSGTGLTIQGSVSSPSISGVHFGSGVNLTGVALTASNNTFTGTQTFAVLNATTSLSSPAIYGNLVAPVTTQTATFTLGLSNAGGVIRIAPASVTQVYVNVPASGTTNFPIGTQTIIAQVSAATVTVSAAAGVTLLSYQSKTSLAAQNSVASLIKTGADEWLLAGDIN